MSNPTSTRTRRAVITSIDSLVEMLKDYCKGQLPSDITAVRMMVHPSTRKIGLVVESPSFDRSSHPIEIKIDIRRVYGVS